MKMFTDDQQRKEALNSLEEGVYSTLEQLLQSQRDYGTDDYNEYVFNIIQPLIEMNILPLKWRNVFESYKEWSGQNFDYGELGDLFLKEFKQKTCNQDKRMIQYN